MTKKSIKFCEIKVVSLSDRTWDNFAHFCRILILLTTSTKTSTTKVSWTNNLTKQIWLVRIVLASIFDRIIAKTCATSICRKDIFVSKQAKLQRSGSPALGQDNTLVHCIAAHGWRQITMAVYHLQQLSGNSGWKVNGTRLFGSFQWKISRRNGTSEKVVPFFQTECSKRKFVYHLFKPHLWYQFQAPHKGKENVTFKMTSQSLKLLGG